MLWILAVCTIPAAWLFVSAVQTDAERVRWRARVAGRFYAFRARVQAREKDALLQTSLDAAGLPLRASTFRTLRLVGILASVFVAGWSVVHHDMFGVLLPVVLAVLTEWHPGFPMAFFFRLLQQRAVKKRNQSVYLLYRLLYQEVLVFQGRPLSVYDLLRRQLPRVPVLAPFLRRCLSEYVDDPKGALSALASNIGTEQAKTLTEMLWQMEEGGASVALDVFQANYEGFQTDRKTDYKQKLSARSLLATGLVLMGLLALYKDINVLVQLYASHILTASLR
jgi:hypothetical protein